MHKNGFCGPCRVAQQKKETKVQALTYGHRRTWRRSWENERCHTKARTLRLHTSLNWTFKVQPMSHTREQQSSSSLFPEYFKEVQSPESWKSSLAAIKQPLSDIFSFLTNTHPPAGLGDTWQPERVVKTYHYKTSIFQKYNLCSIQCFPWKTALLRAIKRGSELMRLAPEVCANNPAKNVKVNNDGGMFCQKQKQRQQQNHQLCSPTSKNFVFSFPLKKTAWVASPPPFISFLIPYPQVASLVLHSQGYTESSQPFAWSHDPLSKQPFQNSFLSGAAHCVSVSLAGSAAKLSPFGRGPQRTH